ncbi:hypothetical protein FA15DRAFT_666937 [Coprinopsis marcescibilis]|uniref:Uncharacterized protein n=1 Tax=Coprinopsis marcescibilis TaxID=230819 RepID=A0A5C3L1Y1_COPMA|nr:hypothetical protein FA15DRAFT_666937 [Coprinopsis marcescibilis]
MGWSMTQAIVVFGLIGFGGFVLGTCLLVIIWRTRKPNRPHPGRDGGLGYREPEPSTTKLTRLSKHATDPDAQALLRTPSYANSGADSEQRSLHEEIESILPEVKSDDAELVSDMREVQGMMLELHRLTTGQAGPLTPSDHTRIAELRRGLARSKNTPRHSDSFSQQRNYS